MQVHNQKNTLPRRKSQLVCCERSQEYRSIIPDKLLGAILRLSPRRADAIQKITTSGCNLQRQSSTVFSI
jgi:hypothetical protein